MVKTLGVLTLLLSCGGSKSSMDVRDGRVGGRGGNVMPSGGGGAAGHAGAIGGAGGAGAIGGAGGGRGRRERRGRRSVATWNPDDCHVTAVANPSDPTASAYWSAARAYCEALSKQGCLTEVALDVAQAYTDARVEACVQEVLWTHSTQVSSPCEDAWNEDIACGAASSFVAPICEGVHLIGYPYGSASTCSRENDALVACLDKNSAMVTVRCT